MILKEVILTGIAMQATSNNVFLNDYPVFDMELEGVNISQCKYADICEIPELSPSDDFSVLLLNIRSCRKNFLEFSTLFSNYFSRFSCIALVETWLSDGYEDLFLINGFKAFNVNRNNYGGGIRLFCRFDLNVKILSDFTFVSNVHEILTVKILCAGKNVVLCVSYHAPSADHGDNYMFIEHNFSLLSRIKALGEPMIVIGDYNLNLLNCKKYLYIQEFINSMLELGLYCTVNIPTKYNHCNEITKFSILDQFWTSIPSDVRVSYVLPIDITDHFAVVNSFCLNHKKTQRTISRRTVSHANNVMFTRNFSAIYPYPVNNDFNDTFNNYFNNVFDIYDSSYPLVNKIIRENRNFPWVTERIRICIKKKSKLYRMYIRGTIIKADYTYYSNKLNTLLFKAERLYHYKKFLEEMKNSEKVWFHINQLLGSNGKSELTLLSVDGRSISGLEMVNYANRFFVNIAHNLTKDLPTFNHCRFYSPRIVDTCFLLPTDAGEVLSIISSLKKKGNGLYDLSVTCLKNNSVNFSCHFALLYNYSIEKECFPDLLKIAQVAAAHKSGSIDNIDNYRPISNLPVISKIFEKLTLRRLVSFVERYTIISDSQFGFQKGRDINQAVIKLTSLTIKAYHDKVYSVCFFLDLRKAFDTVDHNILLNKLDHNGFRGSSNNYLRSYLEGRMQYLQVNNFRSEKLPISKGVPQGSILGPLLFCLYINDLVYAVDAEVILFADDAAFVLTAPTLDLLYTRIKKLFNDLMRYLTYNKLVPNLKKSKLMYFTSRPVPDTLEDISFGTERIEWVSEMKYLGVVLSGKMTFQSHIEKVTGQLSRYIGVFSQLSKSIPIDILKLLYFSFIVPHLCLHIVVWGASPDFHMNKLKTKQNTLLRIILKVPYENGRPLMSNIELYKNLQVLNLDALYKLCLFKFMVQMLSGCLPNFYDMLLRPLLSEHNYNTRAGSFRHPLLSSEIERRSVKHQVILLYENVQQHFYLNMSVHKAVRKYKKYLLSSL